MALLVVVEDAAVDEQGHSSAVALFHSAGHRHAVVAVATG